MMIPRRLVILGLASLPGCAAIQSLNEAATPRDTYELQPVRRAMAGRRSAGTLLVLDPTAPAAIASDRILIRKSPLSVTYLPDVRWSAAVPDMLQSVLIQSLAASGRIGFVGAQGAGPVPDTVLLSRIDQFGVDVTGDGQFRVQVAVELTMLRDRDQRVLGTRQFAGDLLIGSDQPEPITRGFQQLLDSLLPDVVAWVTTRST
ncbi:ABC-type transport auxiliary lipoprotein family protein [Yoonia sediminilitoris]|uniref:Cholesterol transport system auxiliary component n=1 Tax=Yoonia sediminilitoris TaxID=1286148 RepID=A0A2T6KIT6_9RHOB|nr:ABC-type transport auxiliary lipoprotein family protein [Yoonia sediminilitoris]PUB15636.1 cholesterol transport system auxiliary component [Yoonia sediminilitoris]RCW96245.1 cholesterol transport system auxiliary component [Yoonia sediminilitoris]